RSRDGGARSMLFQALQAFQSFIDRVHHAAKLRVLLTEVSILFHEVSVLQKQFLHVQLRRLSPDFGAFNKYLLLVETVDSCKSSQLESRRSRSLWSSFRYPSMSISSGTFSGIFNSRPARATGKFFPSFPSSWPMFPTATGPSMVSIVVSDTVHSPLEVGMFLI